MIDPMVDRGWRELGNTDPDYRNRLREVLAQEILDEASEVAQRFAEAAVEPDTLIQVDTRRTLPRMALQWLGITKSESRKPMYEAFWVVHTRIDAEIDLARVGTEWKGHHTFGIALGQDGELWHFTADAEGRNPRLVHTATVEDLTVKPVYDSYHLHGAAQDGTHEIRRGLRALEEAAGTLRQPEPDEPELESEPATA